MWQNQRSLELEILDLGPAHHTPQEYDTCLRLLCRVNALLGGFRATYRALKSLKTDPVSILEIGCGGGYLCHRLHRWFPKAKVTGIDISRMAISHAEAHLPKDVRRKVTFRLQNSKALEYEESSVEIVTTMLVCHHMSDEELVAFLQDSYCICSKAVIINDLQRHFAAFFSFSLIAPLLFPNRLIWHDGRLSIRRAFRKDDWIRLLKKAGFKKSQYTLKWNWVFRWTLTLIKE